MGCLCLGLSVARALYSNLGVLGNIRVSSIGNTLRLLDPCSEVPNPTPPKPKHSPGRPKTLLRAQCHQAM